ncbi:MAG TPA: DUF2071 domain-containing protein [Pyrinomonadaceae bacterium]|nr:DUF2071 domain-containing protein [Pyrinomonadaceae bacterium]
MRKFLTARWQDLIMANYAIDPSLLESRVPHGTELDLQDGKCFVSLVGFMFLDTRVLGLRIPFHTNFEEINLRFYVKRETEEEMRRGVVFIKEIVPKWAIATIARSFYGEPYETAKMWNRNDAGKVLYGALKGKGVNSIKATRGDQLGVPAEGSHEEFIIEHYWGYTKRGNGRTDEYKVEHPKWELYDTRHVKIRVNFAGWYGKEFAFLKGVIPYSVLLAKGSEIAVYRGQTVR